MTELLWPLVALAVVLGVTWILHERLVADVKLRLRQLECREVEAERLLRPPTSERFPGDVGPEPTKN